MSVNGTNPQTWNRYAYVLNMPLRFVDPFGLWAMDVTYEYYTEGKKKGQVKSTHITFTKSKGNDNAASLLKQFGYKATDKGYAKLLKQFEGKIGATDRIDGISLGDQSASSSIRSGRN